MRWSFLILALVLSIGISLLLSLLTHNFIFFGFLPLVFLPFAGGRRRRSDYRTDYPSGYGSDYEPS